MGCIKIMTITASVLAAIFLLSLPSCSLKHQSEPVTTPWPPTSLACHSVSSGC